MKNEEKSHKQKIHFVSGVENTKMLIQNYYKQKLKKISGTKQNDTHSIYQFNYNEDCD